MSVSDLTPPATDPGTPLASPPVLPGVLPTSLSAALGRMNFGVNSSLTPEGDDDLPRWVVEIFTAQWLLFRGTIDNDVAKMYSTCTNLHAPDCG